MTQSELAPELKQIADKLRHAADENQLLAPVRDLVEHQDASAAVAIQDFNVDRWVAEGRRLAGSKVGITSPAAQQQFGIAAPVYGRLFADMIASNGETIPADSVRQLRIEAEIAFVLKADIDMPDPTPVDVLRAIDFALPAIELVSSRITDWDVTQFDFVADNSAASKLVLGETPLPHFTMDFRTLGAMTIINGQHRHMGSGGTYLGSPLQSLKWLAKESLSAGRPLRRGELVMTGAIGPIVPGNPGDVIEVILGDLPPVRAFIE